MDNTDHWDQEEQSINILYLLFYVTPKTLNFHISHLDSTKIYKMYIYYTPKQIILKNIQKVTVYFSNGNLQTQFS